MVVALRVPYRLARTGTVLLAGAALMLGVAPAAAAAGVRPVAEGGEGLARTPPMGFNNWARYECAVSEAVMLGNAEALLRTGLAARGYRTVTVDDCWMGRARDAHGDLVPDPVKFPHGMRWLGDRLHAMGLRFGIYEDAGTLTCGGYPGSYGHIERDVRRFAAWRVDYLKLDGCNVPVPHGRSKERAYRELYARTGRALARSGRRIVFSESAPAYFCCGTPAWYRTLDWLPRYGQLWREGWDVAVHGRRDKWRSLMTNYGYNVPLARYAGPGHWNDPDFLITGDGLTPAESRTQMALWSMMAAPLILSTDVAAMSADALAVAGNRRLIAIDQDRLGRQATRAARSAHGDVLVKPLSGGSRAVALFNRGDRTATLATTASQAGFTARGGCSYRVQDVWTGAVRRSRGALTARVPAHGTAVFRVTPGRGCAAAVPTGQIENASGACAGDAHADPVALASCTGGARDSWRVPGDGTVRSGGRCLTALTAPADGGDGDGGGVGVRRCDGSARQRWRYRVTGELVSAASGRCLEGAAATRAEGARLRVRPCGDHRPEQLWSLPG